LCEQENETETASELQCCEHKVRSIGGWGMSYTGPRLRACIESTHSADIVSPRVP
jgi:hypothetical protein